MRSCNYIVLIIILGVFVWGSAFEAKAQDPVKNGQTVKVVKEYEPTISDAFKVNALPKIVDTLKVTPEFEYEIFPTQIATKYSPKPIKPAKLKKEPIERLYIGEAKVGAGSYLSPFAQLNLSGNRSKKLNWYSQVRHLSSHGKIKNEESEKVYAGYSDTRVEAGLRAMFRNNNELRVKGGFENRGVWFYGYNPNEITGGLVAPLEKEAIEGRYLNNINVLAGMKSNHNDSAHVNYKVNAIWNSALSAPAQKEHHLNVDADLNYFFENEFVGFDADLQYFVNEGMMDTLNGGVVQFSPWVGAFGKKWEIVAGLRTYFDQNVTGDDVPYHLYPRLSMHYNIIDYFLIPYVEYEGRYETNPYLGSFNRNPFIRQDLQVKPTDFNNILTFGIRGNISSKIAFNAKLEYAKIENQYFFVNDTSQQYHEKFTVVYDTLSQVKVLGEVSYKSSESLFFGVKAYYFHRNMKNELNAWHMPEYKVSFNTRYKLRNKLTMNLNLFAIGKRYAREFDANGQVYSKELAGVIDVNLAASYNYTRRFSVFVELNNLAAVKYYKWNHYPTQRFNFMAGVGYKF